jgi:hypothetical protein
MRLVAERANGVLFAGKYNFNISNNVRTLRDGTRGSHEVIRSIPDDFPYDPRPFPAGIWKITGLDWHKPGGFDPRTYGPVKIKTDAWQKVKVWELDDENDYFRETDREVIDTAYWLHYSAFSTTLGCIRISGVDSAGTLAKIIEAALNNGEIVDLEVI